MSATGRNLAGREYRTGGEYYTPDLVALAIVRWLAPWIRPEDTFLEPHVGAGAFVEALLSIGVPARQIEVMDVDPFAPGLALARRSGCVVTESRPPLSVVESGFLVTPPRRIPTWVIQNPPYSVLDVETGPPCKAARCQGGVVTTRYIGDEYTGKGAREPDRKTCKACRGTGVRPRRHTVAELHVREGIRWAGRHVVALLPDKFLGSDQRNSTGSQRYPIDEASGVFEPDTALFRLNLLRASRCLYPRVSFTGGGTDSAENYVYWFDKFYDRPTFEAGWLGWKS